MYLLQVQQPPPPCVPTDTDPCWNATLERHIFADGRGFHPNEGCGEWFSAKGTKEWSICAYNWDSDPDLDGRFNEVLQAWVTGGSADSFFKNAEWFGLTPP